MNKVLPTFSLEKRLWKKGNQLVIGVDEVGRGAFAGPVTAAAVAFSPKIIGKIKNLGIDDSKRLTSKQREELVETIKKSCLDWSVSSESVAIINQIGILKATERAMRKAIGGVVKQWEMNNEQWERRKSQKTIVQDSLFFILIDGRHVKYISGVGLKNQKNVFGGDRKSISIAAASIIAKVYRDNLMRELAEKGKYKNYDWDQNKGYGTERHIKAIRKYGLTKLHRQKFVRRLFL